MKKLIEHFKKEDKFIKSNWIIYIVTAIVLLINFAYVDILVTSSHGIMFSDALFKEGIFNFYKITEGMLVRGMAASAAYDLPIYFIFAIWNFPLWIIKEITNVVLIDNPFAIIWMKLLPFAFSIGCTYIVKLICEDINIEKKWIKYVVLLFLTSPLITTSVLLIGQYDIIALFFILLGVRAYIKNNNTMFIVWFMVAIPIKLFALFILIPLVLLKEKRIMNIIVNIGSTLFLLLVFKFIEMLMPSYTTITGTFNSGMADRILNGNGFNLILGNAPYWIVIYVLICILCYAINVKNNKELYKWTMYIPFVVYSSFMILCYSHPYWVVYYVPFMIIMFFQNTKYLKVNLLVELMFIISVLLCQFYYYPWCFHTYSMIGTVLPTIFKNAFANGYVSLAGYVPKSFIPSLLSIWLATNIALIVINYPRENTEDKNANMDKAIINIRSIIPLLIGLAIIVLFFAKG